MDPTLLPTFLSKDSNRVLVLVRRASSPQLAGKGAASGLEAAARCQPRSRAASSCASFTRGSGQRVSARRWPCHHPGPTLSSFLPNLPTGNSLSHSNPQERPPRPVSPAQPQLRLRRGAAATRAHPDSAGDTPASPPRSPAAPSSRAGPRRPQGAECHFVVLSL